MTSVNIAKAIHAARHATGGADPVTPASIGAATPTDVTAAVAALVNAAPGAMDTLGEIAAIIASDESAAAALLTSVAAKATTAALTAETTRAGLAEVAAQTTANAATVALTTTAVKTSAYNVTANQFVPTDATSGPVTLTIPTAPPDKTRVGGKKIDASANLVTFQAGGSDVFNTAGGTTTKTLTLSNQALTLQYAAAASIWYLVSDDIPLSQLDLRYDAIGLAAKAVPRWAPATAYTLGQQVVSPNNDVVSAIAAFTSGASYVASNWAVSSTYGRPALGNSVLLFGTSVESQNGLGTDAVDPVDGPTAVDGRGWFQWANAYLGQRMKLVHNGGISGSQTTAQLAALPAQLAAYPSDWVFFGGPVNDPANGTLSTVTIPNLIAMLDLIKASGRRTMMLTCIPSTNYQNNATNKQALSDVNRFIRTLPFTRPDVVVVDAWRVLADQATGNPLALLSDGTVHPSDAGAMRIGKEVGRVMAAVIPERPPFLLPVIDPRNAIGNPSFIAGTGWAAVGAGVTPTYVACPDRQANQANIVLSGITDNAMYGVQYIEPIGNGRYAVGDVIQLSARFQFSNMVPVGVKATFAPFLRVWPRKADSSFGIPGLCFTTASVNQPASITGVPAAGDVVAATFCITLPATTTNLYVMAGWSGAASGTVIVSDLCVTRVN